MTSGEFPVIGQYDVVVAGGGTSGFAAGIAAARGGAKTLVIEEKACLGGNATGGMISVFKGFGKEERELNKNEIFGDMISRMIAVGAATGIETQYLNGLKEMDVPAVTYDPEILKTIIDDMLIESGADVLFNTRVTNVSVENGKIGSVLVNNNSGTTCVKARVFIDATFHGFVAANAGCKWKAGDDTGKMQPGTVMFRMAGVNREAFAKVSLAERTALVKKGYEEGKLPVDAMRMRPMPNGLFFCNMTRTRVDPMDPFQWSRAEMICRKQVRAISEFFIKNIPGFENAMLVTVGNFAALRDSRRIEGKYILTRDDVLASTPFEDAVISCNYPMNMHNSSGPETFLTRSKENFYVPYRCLITDIPNLVVAGRCISTDSDAHAAIRDMVSCLRLGATAGVAASIGVKTNTDVNALNGKEVAGNVRHNIV